MRNVRRSAGAFVIGTALTIPALSAVSPHSLTNMSQELLRIYNAEDVPALHRLLAPSLKAKYTIEALREALVRCRVMTHDVFRFSTPTWGARHFGFFAVYAETSTFEMILEIDEDEHLLHLVITDDVTSKDQQCIINDHS